MLELGELRHPQKHAGGLQALQVAHQCSLLEGVGGIGVRLDLQNGVGEAALLFGWGVAPRAAPCLQAVEALAPHVHLLVNCDPEGVGAALLVRGAGIGHADNGLLVLRKNLALHVKQQLQSLRLQVAVLGLGRAKQLPGAAVWPCQQRDWHHRWRHCHPLLCACCVNMVDFAFQEHSRPREVCSGSIPTHAIEGGVVLLQQAALVHLHGICAVHVNAVHLGGHTRMCREHCAWKSRHVVWLLAAVAALGRSVVDQDGEVLTHGHLHRHQCAGCHPVLHSAPFEAVWWQPFPILV
mmetsp:Transcript_3090/g.8776  ORF Transcript_3090/g.8776 Transcript_3090/m.8776 type:complete len:294 (+) Transcript_3090:1157-2038(+)